MITDLTDYTDVGGAVGHCTIYSHGCGETSHLLSDKSEKSVIRKKEIRKRKEEAVLNDINTSVICKQMQ